MRIRVLPLLTLKQALYWILPLLQFLPSPCSVYSNSSNFMFQMYTDILFLRFIYLLLFKYSCLHFHPTRLPCPTHPRLLFFTYPLWLSPYVLYTCSLTPFPYFPPPPLWLLSVCPLFQCLWLCFACLFVLLIRFHLYVRSHCICLSSPGLFHLA